MENTRNEAVRKSLKVYRKDGKWGYWYSATRSDGKHISVVFDKEIQVPDVKAFEISKVVGTLKQKTVEQGGEVYENYTYYVTSCDIGKIVGDELPL